MVIWFIKLIGKYKKILGPSSDKISFTIISSYLELLYVDPAAVDFSWWFPEDLFETESFLVFNSNSKGQFDK